MGEPQLQFGNKGHVFGNNFFKKNHGRDSEDLEMYPLRKFIMLFAGDKQPSILYANSCQQVHDGIIDNI
jgi:hypothetical protein